MKLRSEPHVHGSWLSSRNMLLQLIVEQHLWVDVGIEGEAIVDFLAWL